jgi:hypothetical protein
MLMVPLDVMGGSLIVATLVGPFCGGGGALPPRDDLVDVM